ncbi:hypothetical protein RI129_012477 [Pyrocoelia pectoralis]|uniref:CRAL-TRIO domain-containing protein n=1 Tax=Pyrocoelia pectoralis TaxID=417401 RepID=A0AAN7ZC47_9COLE
MVRRVLLRMKIISVEHEYGKDQKLRKEDVMILKQWTEMQCHLPHVSELHLMFFLHSCYYNIEMAKSAIESFFTIRTHCPEFFKNRNPKSTELVKQMNVGCCVDLPKKTPEGNQILLYKFLDRDVGKFDANEQMKLFDMGIVHCLMQNGTSEGVVVVCDFKGASFAHLLKINVSIVSKVFPYLQQALFIRLKAIHYLNVGLLVDGLMSLVKPFLKSELIDSVHVHNSIETLIQHIPIECLPSDYGGSQPSFKELHEDHCQRLFDFADYFIDEDTYIVDETKRIGKPSNPSEIFGLDGTFKQIEID